MKGRRQVTFKSAFYNVAVALVLPKYKKAAIEKAVYIISRGCHGELLAVCFHMSAAQYPY
jgi:hypothetical protein